MPFTPEEIRQWHDARRKLQVEPERALSEPIATCIHCQKPFGANEGVVEDDVALCDVCNGD
jgi:formylmethanofuran dehydrogenase subunit E